MENAWLAPTMEESITMFAGRVAQGKTTPEELAFMTEVARGTNAVLSIDGEEIARATACSRR